MFGKKEEGVDSFVTGDRGMANTSELVSDPGSFLGICMEMVRDREGEGEKGVVDGDDEGGK